MHVDQVRFLFSQTFAKAFILFKQEKITMLQTKTQIKKWWGNLSGTFQNLSRRWGKYAGKSEKIVKREHKNKENRRYGKEKETEE